MEIQQHDGVVVEVAGSRQGFAKRKRGGRGVTGGRERRQGLGFAALPPPTIYRTPGGGGAPPASCPPRAPCRVDSSSHILQIFQKYSPSVFIPFGFRLIWGFCET